MKTDTEKMYQQVRATVRRDLLETLAEARKSNQQNDFLTGYAFALQSVSNRMINSLIGTMERALNNQDLAGDILGIFTLHSAMLVESHAMRSSPLPEENLNALKETVDAFTNMYATLKLARSLGIPVSKFPLSASEPPESEEEE